MTAKQWAHVPIALVAFALAPPMLIVALADSLYVAALRAGEEMANELGDAAFAKRCREIFETGQKSLVAQLFDGEYFINKQNFRIKVSSYCKCQSHIHARRITLNGGIKKFFNLCKCNYFIKFLLDFCSPHP